MIGTKKLEAWFVTGSQHLYGAEILKKVDEHAKNIVKGLNATGQLSVKIVLKPVVTTPDEIFRICEEANTTSGVVGLITWMHTFSPAKMWIAGLSVLNKPFVHLHTQFNRDIPWADIDMNFMNLNQSAHGDREFGYISTRMGLERKVIAGHWKDPEVISQLDVWLRSATGWYASKKVKIARFGDNMREVAVTEGDKVDAQIRFGWSVNGYALGDLAAYIRQVSKQAVDHLCQQYEDEYHVMDALRKGGAAYDSLREAARIELGLRAFLEEGGFNGFTDTFENLHGLSQLPGLAVQRLMKDGYGFGAEGDWKTAAMLHIMKTMSRGLPGGNSFMEDYTYHFDPAGMYVLGAHMLEICPSLTNEKPGLEVHPLAIGGKKDPLRLLFNVPQGSAINVSVIDLGTRFRIIVNEVETIDPPEEMPKLPTARVLWRPMPDLKTAAAAWIYAGGSHHTVFSQSLSGEYIRNFAEMAGVEFMLIDKNTSIHNFKNNLRWNAVYYHSL